MLVWFCIFVYASAAHFVSTGEVMTGQPHEVPVNNTKVVTAARFAVAEFNRANPDDAFGYKIMNITAAKIQVVAGLNYILEVQLGRITCRTSDTADGEQRVYFSAPKASPRF